MWRKETRWHSFSREHSGVKLFSQRASCSQLELEVGWHLAELEIYGRWVILGPQHWRPSRRQQTPSRWRPELEWLQGRAMHGSHRLQAEFWGQSAYLSFHSGHSWADGQVSRTGLGLLPVLWPPPPLHLVLWIRPIVQLSSQCWCQALLWEPRRSFGPVFRGTDLAFICWLEFKVSFMVLVNFPHSASWIPCGSGHLQVHPGQGNCSISSLQVH